jgi:hypothetical protein
MSWKAVDLGENEAKQKAMDLDVVFDQYGERTNADRRQVQPPVPVESATWQSAGELDYWVAVPDAPESGADVPCCESHPSIRTLVRIRHTLPEPIDSAAWTGNSPPSCISAA